MDCIYAMKKAAKESDFYGNIFGLSLNEIAGYEVLVGYLVGALWILLDLVNSIRG